ncbi:MAG: hypothetical protein Q9M97_10315 [Candidatus Gracilibacteria bacterium]|nr:hypothetical protein [Candidatus Gracilibacteria bacterium]
MKNIKQYKSFIIGLIIGLLLIGSGTYAATTGSGTIGSLFEKIGSVYKLIGTNITNNSITSTQLGEDSVGNSELKTIVFLLKIFKIEL